MDVAGAASARDAATPPTRGTRRRPRPKFRQPEEHGGVAQSHTVEASSSGPQTNGPQVNTGHRRGRGMRGFSQGRRGGGIPRLARPFGGQLTTESSAVPGPELANSSPLQADAPAFQPGQGAHQTREPQRATRSRGTRPRPGPRRNFVHASHDLDLGSRIHNDISHGVYECGICTDKVYRRSWIWSCDTCWTVFHLDCVKKWARKDIDQAQLESQNNEASRSGQWRCPGCNLHKKDVPSEYTCWCQKETKPRPPSGCPPSSCGQTCGKPRAGRKPCPHPCDEICHAGPCPPCSKLGPQQTCFCGKTSVTKKCLETNYDTGWSCGQLCGDMLPCGEHVCQRTCHEGMCGGCEYLVAARCYCGKVDKDVKCHETGTKKESYQLQPSDGKPETWTGAFSCEMLCERPFDCGKHACSRSCHAQDLEPLHCPLSPDVVKSCHCGKAAVSKLLPTPRQDCEEPVPSCGQTCSKSFRCGHRCPEICHSGECPPCYQTKQVNCRCGRTQVEVICAEQQASPSCCDRTCKAALNCGRHACAQRCCPGEAKAANRRALIRQLGHSAATTAGPDVESEHICTKTCGRQLKCGNHTCPELCHKGACSTCREAIFEELACNCGKTILEPPVPCGTRPPPCHFPCDREPSCGHPKIPHLCHGDEHPCPECPYLVERLCMCGRERLKNRPCFQKNVTCGQVCGKKLSCQLHECQRTCHRSGQCEDAEKPCRQLCASLKTCGHPCEKPCHASEACKEDRPCQSKVMITCDCQNLKNEAKCLASQASEGSRTRTLKCNEECARLERNLQLARALNIDPDTHTNDFIPYSTETLNLYQKSVAWAQEREQEMRIFAADESEKILRFKPASGQQRAFLHALAGDFGLDGESMDPEPHRHVTVFKTPRFVSMPMKTLAECVRIRNRTAAAASTVAAPPTAPRIGPARQAFNGFLLTSPMFALTIEELRAALAPTLTARPTLAFDISFLPSEAVALKVSETAGPSPGPEAVEAELRSLRPALVATIATKHLAGATALCALDGSLNVLRTDRDAAEGGWNVVAARSGAPASRLADGPAAAGNRSGFVVLGGGGGALKKNKRKKRAGRGAEPGDEDEEEEVVEDWFEAVLKEEQEQEQEVN